MSFKLTAGIFVLVLTGIGIYLGGQWLKSDRDYLKVLEHLDTWRENEAVASIEEWEEVRLAMEEVIEDTPGEPRNYMLLGLVHEWRGFAIEGEEISFLENMASRQNAVNAYREAARLRPAHAVGWSHLARMKVLSGQQDDEFKSALRNAIQQGQNESGNILEVTYIASMSWGTIEMDPQLRLLVTDTLVRGLEESPSKGGMLNYLGNRNLMGNFCPQINLEKAGERVRLVCEGI